MSDEGMTITDPDENTEQVDEYAATKKYIARKWILGGFGTSDSEIARRFANANCALRHSPTLGWFYWNSVLGEKSGVWRAVSREMTRQIVRTWMSDHIEAFKSAAQTEHKICEGEKAKTCSTACMMFASFHNALRRYESARNLTGILTELATQPNVLVDNPTLFDAHPHLFNVKNGVVDLRDGTLLTAKPEWLMTKQAGADYISGAMHEDWTQALDALGDLTEETQSWFQRFMGSGCSGHTLTDALNVFLHGNGANGKSTVVGAADTALGAYAGVVPDAALEAGSKYEQAVAMLSFRGLRFALLEETTDDMRLATTALKKLSSGNKVNARVLNKGNVEFPASHTLAIATNHTPYVREADKATWRRLVLVPFAKDYTREVSFDSEIRERLIEGLDGRAEAVLAWLVAGCVDWYKSGRSLTPLPAELQNATNEWREETDVLGQFLSERVETTGAASDRWDKAGVFGAFESWCALTSNKNPYSSQRGFNTAFRNHEYVARAGVQDARGTAGVRQWQGVRSLGHSSVTPEYSP